MTDSDQNNVPVDSSSREKRISDGRPPSSARDVNTHTRDLRDELLIVLAEECAEVQQAVANYLRHGGDCYNPDDPKQETNRATLHRELGDLFAALRLLAGEDIISLHACERHANEKEQKHREGRTPLYHLRGASGR